MTDRPSSVQAMLVSASSGDRYLFRKAASASSVPIEMIEADSAGTAVRSIAAGVDLVLFDPTLGHDAIAQVLGAAVKAEKPPFTILMTDPESAIPAFTADAVAAKPAQCPEAETFMESVSRVRRMSRVLVLDDSATMRSIVRKILLAARFPLDVSEAVQGSEAIELARKIDFGIIFLDYNLPGFSGLETMAEIRREKRNPIFVLITSAQDKTIESGARAQGAAFLKKPFFVADVEAVLCNFYGLRALNPQRSKPS